MRQLFFVLSFVISSSVIAADFDAVKEKLEKSLASDIRTEKEKDRDANRMPIRTLEFFGLRDDMKVLELVPGGGWYTKVLAPVLKEKGQLYVSIGARRVKDNVLNLPGMESIKIVETNPELKFEREDVTNLINIQPFEFGVTGIDMVLTFRNYHNFGEAGRKAMNEAAFKSLKKGGIYGVVDHTKRHMEEFSSENRRRFDPVLAIKEIQEAGFEFVDFSDNLFRLDDELRYEVGRKSVTGNSDRFTLLFKKPE